jgi:hypothetical protein
MALNLDLTKANTKRVSLGTGRLWVVDFGSGNGTTPTSSNDIGLGRGGSLNITRQKQELILGTPKQLILQYAIQEDVTLGFNSVEWRPSAIKKQLGSGVYSTLGGTTDTFLFGGDMKFDSVAVRFVHDMANGGTLFLDLWKAQGEGQISLNFGDDFHEIPYSFKSLSSTAGWGGEDLSLGGSFFRMIVWIPGGITPN